MGGGITCKAQTIASGLLVLVLSDVLVVVVSIR